jgi:hypothetical protein
VVCPPYGARFGVSGDGGGADDAVWGRRMRFQLSSVWFDVLGEGEMIGGV